jgi:hypothetical protein
LYPNDSLIEGAPPDEAIQSVHVPCATLTLENLIDAPCLDTESCEAGGDKTWWQPVSSPGRIELRAKPQADAAAVILQAQCHHSAECVQFERIAESGAWMRVRRHGENACVVGWIRRSQLRRVSAGSAGESHDYSLTGPPSNEIGEMIYPNAAPGTYYEGPASVRIGTAVHDCSAAGGAWATVAKADTFKVHFVKGNQWAELLEIPGLGGGGVFACVPVSSLVLPDGKR